jgi:hypothetical protein
MTGACVIAGDQYPRLPIYGRKRPLAALKPQLGPLQKQGEWYVVQRSRL